jgi:hypothetical protein
MIVGGYGVGFYGGSGSGEIFEMQEAWGAMYI